MEKLTLFCQIAFFKTLLINVYYFGFNFWKIPILVYRHTHLDYRRGKMTVTFPLRFGMLQIGRRRNGFVNQEATLWYNRGSIILRGRASIGRGSQIIVSETGILTFGDEFCSSGDVTLTCNKSITFGSDNLLAWNILLMDTDCHHILNLNGSEILNPPLSITIGDHVWIGCNVTVLKGVNISDNTVIAANSTITKSYAETNVVLGSKGILKTGINWRY